MALIAAVNIYIRIYTHIYMHKYIHIHVCTYMYIRTNVYIYVCADYHRSSDVGRCDLFMCVT